MHLDGYSKGFDLHLRYTACQYKKDQVISYNNKKMKITWFFINDTEKNIDIWAQPANDKNAPSEKLMIEHMQIFKKRQLIIVCQKKC